MPKKSFKDLAQEAIDYTKEGLDKLVEVHELQEALKNLPKSESYEQLAKEIIEKEKIAISLIQQATLIERTLMTSQHKAVEMLINNLS
jgi:hypothetical protein